ncbi:MAG TPA: hypothetical protein VMU09_11140 [Acidimicrobiales bacterium]|nr:hypothetical protein [Acidimicrobiales bacterium]
MARGRNTEDDEPRQVMSDDLLAALLDNKLTPFEGRDVIKSTIVIKKAGDGLSQPLQFRPVELIEGQEVFVLLRTVVDNVSFPRIKDTEASARKHDLVTLQACTPDREWAEEQFRLADAEVQSLREEAVGLQAQREREERIARGELNLDDAMEDADGAGDA